METVRALVEENVPEQTDPKACAAIDEQEASEGGTAFNCVDEKDLATADVMAIHWEFADAEEARKFIDSAGTSAEYHLVADNVVVDGPNALGGGLPDPQEFLGELSERCGCGEVEKKEL